MEIYMYCRIRITGDGLVSAPDTCRVACASRIEFLEKLNAWNRNLPGQWQYYANNTYAIEREYSSPE